MFWKTEKTKILEEKIANIKQLHEKKGKLPQKKKKELEKYESQLRAQKIRVWIVIGMLLLGGFTLSTYLSVKKHHQQSKKQTLTSENSPSVLPGKNEERELDELIKKAERGFKKFEELVTPKINKLNDKKLKKALLLPFYAMKLNKDNPHKNYLRFHRGKEDKPGDYYPGPRVQFFYSLSKKGDPEIPSFHPTKRRMRLWRSLDENNLIDMLHLYHELVHVLDDNYMRQNIKSEADNKRYMDITLLPEKYAVGFETEVNAYFMETMVFMILLKDELEGPFQTDGKFNITKMKKVLNMRDNQVSVLKHKISFAYAWHTNPNLHSFSIRIFHFYQKLGWPIYKVINGKLQRIG